MKKSFNYILILGFIGVISCDKESKTAIEKEVKVIKTIAKDIVRLKSDKTKIEIEIKKIREMLDSIDVNDKIDYDEERYLQAKKRLKRVESQIFKNEFSKKQFEQNIDNLEQKEYEEEGDFLPLNGEESAVVTLEKGDFLICYPEDAHMTAIKVDESKDIKKAIFKVKII